MECSRTPHSQLISRFGSNNTNKWNAQEPKMNIGMMLVDQIIPINGMLKNVRPSPTCTFTDQIIPINGMLKN